MMDRTYRVRSKKYTYFHNCSCYKKFLGASWSFYSAIPIFPPLSSYPRETQRSAEACRQQITEGALGAFNISIFGCDCELMRVTFNTTAQDICNWSLLCCVRNKMRDTYLYLYIEKYEYNKDFAFFRFTIKSSS